MAATAVGLFRPGNRAACGFRRLRPLIPNEGGHLFQSKAARVSEDPGRVVSSSADG